MNNDMAGNVLADELLAAVESDEDVEIDLSDPVRATLALNALEDMYPDGMPPHLASLHAALVEVVPRP